MKRAALHPMTTGVPGLDEITDGGLPRGRTTLVAGTAGSGKTVLALQFIYTGIQEFNEPGVVVTFEESPDELKRNVFSLGWDLDALEDAGTLAFVDASPEPGEEIVESGSYDLTALLARIEYAVTRTGAKRVVLDAIGSIFPQFKDPTVVRRELHRIAGGLRILGVTALMTIERSDEYGPIARFSVEEFVADNVIILRNQLEQEKRRRTIEVLKIRGASHRKGEFPFTINRPTGLTIVPLTSIMLTQPSTDIRISSGNAELDEMCGGGMMQNSIILISGATGTGKTLMSTEFTKAAITNGQRALVFAYEESREQLFRNALSWGVDYQAAEDAGLLKVICRYPETMGLEEHLIVMQEAIEEFQPDRIAVDSMSALERGATVKSFREFVIGITGHIKAKGMAGLFTNTTSMLVGGESITETHISTITDSIILLRYVELFGEMRRGLAVLKMRGSQHDKEIREYTIGNDGMTILGQFLGVNGILSGVPVVSVVGEKDRLTSMFSDANGAGE
ncbi:circadian clock protein KaiC [Tritonibacter horizontis]|uniref:non-specific serine/threonine protein kinase n=1 Tax=Tritonibacter horizontis TaxID=1768241 RepID=A0A132BQE0_9RHOB|nr:circadian clock protein KaiC [Tritonibacter horizontis]KUP90564.1 circadian clock protein kinase KaiC [Tritonibacter horizontis]